MNKSVLMAGAFIALAGAAQAADDMGLKPYVGVDVVNVKANYEDGLSAAFDDRVNGLGIYGGLQLTKNVGLELGYMQTGDGEKTDIGGSGVDTKVRISGITADVVGTLPVSADGRFAVLGSAGVGRYKARISATGVVAGTGDDSDFGYRLGAGAQYQFSDNWSARAMLRYTKVDFDDAMNNLVTGSVGVNYKF